MHNTMHCCNRHSKALDLPEMAAGLKIRAKLDRKKYETGKKVADEQFSRINLTHGKTLSLWYYSITPY